MEKKTKLIRRDFFLPRPSLPVSQFTIKAKSVIEVLDVDDNKLKYQYTPFTNYLTVFGSDVEEIYVTYID